jgi:hypothetical protein
MANSVSITVDPNALAESMLTLSQALKPFIKVASRISADNIAREAQARLARQLSGHSTGETLAGIKVKSDRTGWGWIVDAGNATQPMLDRWIESGTKQGKPGSHSSPPRPFFWASAQLEEQAHLGRVRAAIAAGMSEHGIGDVT